MIKLLNMAVILLLCIACVGKNDAIKKNDTLSNFVIDPDYKWHNIEAKTITDEEKISKTNLFIKCYYYENGDICKTILTNFEKECDEGVGLSCGLLSVASRDARGVSRDPQKTLEYIKKGCYFNDSLSCMYMRQKYIQEGNNVIASKILESIKKKCVKDGTFECLLLSIVYENDEMLAKNNNINITSYKEKACKKEFALACAYLDSKQLGKKTYQQYQKQACDLGMLSACDALRESVDLNVFTQHSRLFRIW